MTINAANSDPRAEPKVPPTWNTDSAKPCLPPAAIRAIRDTSGMKHDEPSPTSPAPTRSTPKVPAPESRTSPTSAQPMPATSE